jgi:methionyl-tRNA synthetase
VEALDSFGAPGNDALRYYLLRDTPFGQDASFSYDGLVQRYNSDLANDLGNLANRTITMINRYFDGLVPKPVSELGDPELRLRAGLFGGCLPDPRYLTKITGLIQAYTNNFERFYLQPMVGRVWDLIALLNGYLVERQPWKLGESDDDANRSLLTLTLYTASDLLRTIAIMLYPILPFSAERLWKQLGCEGDIRDQRSGDLKWQGLEPGTKVGKPEPIFPRLDKTVETPSGEKPAIIEQTPAQPAAAPAAATPATDKISIEDFAKVEMRVGEILSAEPIPKADKWLKLQVDIGTEVRQVCAGIAEHYRPEQLVGMKVVLVTNLQPRKLRGVESNGMIVAASVGEEGRPVLATFKEDVPKGAKLR